MSEANTVSQFQFHTSETRTKKWGCECTAMYCEGVIAQGVVGYKIYIKNVLPHFNCS